MSESVRTSYPASNRGQRRLKNLLIDRRFQLKYSGYLVAIAVFVSAGLGIVLWQTSQTVLVQSREAVGLGEGMVDRGRKLLQESEKVNSVVRMSIADAYGNDPALLEVFQSEAEDHDRLLRKSQRDLESNARDLRNKALSLERQSMFFSLVICVAVVLLVVAVGLAGVVVTHKVAGPIFKMKRLLRALAKGHFRVVARLRKGDELQDFFDAFNEAARELAERQETEIAEITKAVALLEEAGADPGKVKQAKETLKSLKQSMHVSLQTLPPYA